jgi:hypothetical protein
MLNIILLKMLKNVEKYKHGKPCSQKSKQGVLRIMRAATNFIQKYVLK